MMLGAVLTLAGFLVLAGIVILGLFQLRRLRAKLRGPGEGRRCGCGYLLARLEVPRCPECGRMIGFDKSPEELGVSEEEMRAAAEQRRATRGSADIP